MILAKEKEIEIVLTYKCNWDCSYCCVLTHKQPKINPSELKEKIDKIIPGYHVTLSGGEVGLLSKIEILEIMAAIKDKGAASISLNTNGLFLKNYPELIKEFQTVLYHVSAELDINDTVLELKEYHNIEYMILVTDEIIDKVSPFLRKYPDITFNIVAASNPLGVKNPFLSQKNKWRLLKEFRHRMTKDSKIRLVHEKDFDSIIYI